MKLVILSWLLGTVGFGLVVAGVAMVHVPAACVIAGLALLAYAKLLDRAAAAMAPAKKEE